MSTLKGNVRISRWTSSKAPYAGIEISLTDELSGCECVEIQLTPEQLGLALTGQGVDCEFTWRPTHVGLKSEHKTELVEFSGSRDDRKAQEKAVAPFETDGWMCNDYSSLYNHHRHAGGNKYRVGFVRFVAPDQQEEKAK